MANRIKSIVVNGLPYGIVFFVLSLFTGYMLRVDQQQTTVMAAIIATAAIVLYGLLSGRFSKSTGKLEELTANLNMDEPLLLECAANHRIEEILVPGKLFLTNKRLIFKIYKEVPGDFGELSWQLEDISPAGFYGTAWNSGGEFLLKTAGNATLMFEVEKLKSWKTFFTHKI